MTIEALVARYGVAAVFLGAGLEGETAVVAGGVLAHRGLVPLAGVAVAAMAGSFVADQGFFQFGRHFREHGFVRRARARPAFAKALAWMERWPRAFVFGYRFVYGIRTVSPIALGTSGVSTRVFLAVNAVAAVIWGALFTGVGYVFGHGLEALAGRIGARPLVIGAVAAVAVAGLAAFGWRRWRAA